MSDENNTSIREHKESNPVDHYIDIIIHDPDILENLSDSDSYTDKEDEKIF